MAKAHPLRIQAGKIKTATTLDLLHKQQLHDVLPDRTEQTITIEPPKEHVTRGENSLQENTLLTADNKAF